MKRYSVNFRLKQGSKFSIPESPLYVVVLNVGYRGGTYTKAKIELRYKSNDMLLEVKTYKLEHELIEHWEVYCSDFEV